MSMDQNYLNVAESMLFVVVAAFFLLFHFEYFMLPTFAYAVFYWYEGNEPRILASQKFAQKTLEQYFQSICR